MLKNQKRSDGSSFKKNNSNKGDLKSYAPTKYISLNLIRLVIISSFMAISSTAVADLQAPPRGKYTPVRKLSRALANIIYGVQELPSSIYKHSRISGPNAAVTHGIVDGVYRTGTRFGYGVFELVTFPYKSYKRGYKEPYKNKAYKDVYHGYKEFPPELGFISKYEYARSVKY